MYEPGGRDDSSYTVYVLYQSWISCLIRYLQNERNELFNKFIYSYMLANIDGIFGDLAVLQEMYPSGYYETRCFEIDRYIVDYTRLTNTLQNYYNYIDFTEHLDQDENEVSFEEFMSREYTCCICYDTKVHQESQEESEQFCLETCKHSFHKECLRAHIETNTNICPMCRGELSESDFNRLTNNVVEPEANEVNEVNEWMINPLTRRRIKVGGKTWIYLKECGTI
jgi:hypothetical protein